MEGMIRLIKMIGAESEGCKRSNLKKEG